MACSRPWVASPANANKKTPPRGRLVSVELLALRQFLRVLNRRPPRDVDRPSNSCGGIEAREDGTGCAKQLSIPRASGDWRNRGRKLRSQKCKALFLKRKAASRAG